MHKLFLLCFVASVSGFDFVVESFKKYVDPDVEPCDNFYRHACKLGSTMMETTFDNFVQEVLSQESRSWDNFHVLSDLKQLSQSENSLPVMDQILDLYVELYENGQDTELFIEYFEAIIDSDPNDCDGRPCYKYVLEDPDCHRGRTHLGAILNQSEIPFDKKLNDFESSLESLIQLIHSIDVLLEQDVREGIEIVKQFLDEMKVIGKEWIEDTPWVNNNNVTNSTITALFPTVIEDNYGKLFRDAVDSLTKVEMIYRDCKSGYNDIPTSNVFCLVYTLTMNMPPGTEGWFSIVDGFITYPRIGFGYVWYHVAKYSDDMSAKLGFTGSAVGHEMSHTLIKSSPADFLTYFSDEVKECIQEQFNSTCATFKENSCKTIEEQFDDNGADIMGVQLSYKLLENYYGTKLNQTYMPLGVTHQQLFFYSLALSFCDGLPGKLTGETSVSQHSSSYIRVNAVLSQLPAFKQAFQCSANTRMMQSKTDECIVYGEGAPEMKKH